MVVEPLVLDGDDGAADDVGDPPRPHDNAVLARASESHGVSNETGENLVLLVTMAPRPS